MGLERKEELLRQCHKLFKKQQESPFVLNLLEEEIEEDGVSFCGETIWDDIKLELELDEYSDDPEEEEE